MEHTGHACSPLISLPLLTFLFSVLFARGQACFISALLSDLLGQTGDYTGPAT